MASSHNAVPPHWSVTSVSSSPQTCPSYVPAKYLNKCHQLHESVRVYTRPKHSYRRTRLYFLNAVTYPVSFTALRWCLYCAMCFRRGVIAGWVCGECESFCVCVCVNLWFSVKLIYKDAQAFFRNSIIPSMHDSKINY